MKVVLRTDMLTLTTPLEAVPHRARRLARHHRAPTSGPSTPPGSTSSTPPRRRSTGCSCGSARPAGSTTSTAGTTTPRSPSPPRMPCAPCSPRSPARPSAPAATSSSASWSVGVGAVGDMHTNPQSYAAVLDGIDSPGAGRLDEVHPRRLLQPPAAQRDAALRQPAADRGVPEPSRVRELRRVPQRPRRGVPRRPAAAARRQPAHRGRVGVDPGRRARGAPAR